jgi:hypothetical protein
MTRASKMYLEELLPFHVFESVPHWFTVLIERNSLKVAHVLLPPGQSKCGLWRVSGDDPIDVRKHTSHCRSEFLFVSVNTRQHQGLVKPLVAERTLCCPERQQKCSSTHHWGRADRETIDSLTSKPPTKQGREPLGLFALVGKSSPLSAKFLELGYCDFVEQTLLFTARLSQNVQKTFASGNVLCGWKWLMWESKGPIAATDSLSAVLSPTFPRTWNRLCRVRARRLP